MKPGKYVVSGGSGFLGKALARALRREGFEVHTLARSACTDLEAEGIVPHRVDLSAPPASLAKILEGAEAVFHTAAKVEMWGRYEDFYAVNVDGTNALLEASRAAGVPKFIFTSSPSVIADGTDLCGIDESKPYPSHFEAYYPQTKAMAEAAVLSAHNPSGIRTLSLRPHLIFGPGDTNLVPTILARARARRLVQVGQGTNLVDFTFIDDCVAAHCAAADALDSNPRAGGRAYFISQGEPVNMWEWIREVLARSGLPPLERRIPLSLAMLVASASELAVRLLPGNHEPLLTRFLVSEMATSHYFDISAARRELGYAPAYTMREAMEETFGG